MSRLLSDLVPEVRVKCEALLVAAKQSGHPLLITQTWRTAKEQAALYAQGRTTPGKIVTNAPPGFSWHEFGRAFDVVFLHGKKISYDGPWDWVGELGESFGLDWGGRWKRPDRPHFEDSRLTLRQAREAGYLPKRVV